MCFRPIAGTLQEECSVTKNVIDWAELHLFKRLIFSLLFMYDLLYAELGIFYIIKMAPTLKTLLVFCFLILL